MKRYALLAVVAVCAMPDISHAAGDAETTTKDAEAVATKPPLPASMQRHGVIGRVPLPDGMDILDADILARMRDRLIILSQTPKE
ncbi:hypothetical protein SAMN04488040_3119 [Sulfitobacter marinus]|uniref:Uncharacterized protein n=1 Tax=Sulfitobacter marinus TaxID=394264 RepID=A0A1I6V6I5_9RHOB|nr:hypothetical protein [Sulfitobacter marinus]SFT09205.1 hypothetical protein SAMN04488040_3119 [Sulfitobacter marinus]